MRPSLAVVLALLGCPAPSTPTRPDSGPPPAKLVHLVVLGNERGQLVDRAPGLAALLEREAPAPDSLVLSIGSTFSGTDLATVFEGAATAEAMKQLSVAAMTVSAADLDFGAPRLAALRDTSGATLLLSSVRDTSGALGPSSTFALFERQRVKVGVIGVADVTPGDGPFEALPLEGALASTTAMAEEQGAQVVVLLVAGCSRPVTAALARNPAWRVDLVVARACPDTSDGRVGATAVLHLDAARAHVAHLRTELGAVRSLSARLLDVPAVPESERLAALRRRFATSLEASRQQALGFSRAQLSSDDVARLVARALKVTAKADAGLYARAGVRAGLPTGALLRGHLLDAVPGAERVVLVDVPGEVLTKLVSHPDAVLELPPRVDPLGTYVLATTAFLAREGIGLTAVDANPVDTRVLVGPSLEAWLVGEGTSPARPLSFPTKRSR